jgi:fimbrial isopeptide formation D2 family protein
MDYVIHDTMSAGLELIESTIAVKHNDTVLNKPADYTIVPNCTDNCTFAIDFTETLDTAEGDKITVTYKATVTKEIPATATNTAKIADSSSQVELTPRSV